MSTSVLLFAISVLCGLVFAWGVAWVQADCRLTRKTFRWPKPALALAGCTAFGALAFFLNSGVAETTLYEIDTEGSAATVPNAVQFTIPVEHAGAEHDLLVDPKGNVTKDPLDVRVELTDVAGHVVFDDSAALEPRCDDDTTGCEWDSYGRTFTPTTAGAYTLTVTLLTPDIPDLHVRVGDPEKRDGHRAPGY